MTFCKNIKKFIKFFDYFGGTISFQINDEYEYKSIIGGICSIIFFFISLSFISYSIFEFLNLQNLSFIYSNKIVYSGPSLNLKDLKFTLSFGLDISSNSPISDLEILKYFIFSMKDVYWIGEDSIEKYEYGLKYCEKSDFYFLKDDIFDLNGLKTLYCPILNGTNNYSLEGLYTDYYYKYIEIDISISEYGFKNFEFLSNYLSNYSVQMSIYFLDTSVDYQNHLKPINKYVNNLYQDIDIYFEKIKDILIAKIEFSDDNNLIINHPKYRYEAVYDYSFDSFHSIDKRSLSHNEIGKFLIRASPKIIKLVRQNQKLQSLIADIAGILEEIFLFAYFILNIFERKAIDYKLMHRMLKFRGSKYYDIDYLENIYFLEKSNRLSKILDNKNLKIKKNFFIEKKINDYLFNINKSFINNKNILENQEKNNEKNDIIKKCLTFSIDKNSPTSKNNNQNKNIENIEEKTNEIKKNSNEKKIKKKSILKNENNYKFLDLKKIHSIQFIDKKKSNLSNLSLESSNSKILLNNFFSPQNKKICKLNQNFDNISIKSVNTILKDHFFETNKLSLERENKSNENFISLNLIQIFFANFFCFCNKKLKKRYLIFKSAEKKIHYYLDIFNYINKIQEIDIIKYCLFDEDQLVLLKFLSKPPYKFMGVKGSLIYNEFEDTQTKVGRLGKKEIQKLISSFNKIANKKDLNFEDIKLLRLVNADIEFLK